MSSVLSAPSQVLVRNLERFSQGRWLLVNPTDSQIFNQLGDADLTGFHQYFDQYQRCLKTDSKQSFSVVFETEQPFDGAIVYACKAKQHNAMLLANIAESVRPGGELLLVGENKSGIKSLGKQLGQFGRVVKVDSARHCSLFAVQVESQASGFQLTQWQHQVDIQLADLSYKIVTLPGVFSAEHLDPGTELLLNNADRIPSGQVLDFACGAGVIGCYLGLKNTDSSITMSDVNALALHCAEQSAQLNQINAKVVASDGLAEITGRFQAIFTNPPFHTGIKIDYKITQIFIQQVKQYLQPGANLTLVANRFLSYPDLLQQTFNQVEVKAQNGKFNLYVCRA